MSEYKFSKTPNATVEQINAAWEGFQSDHAAALTEAQAEIARLREELGAFLGVWAVEYAKRMGFADGELHPQHYARMFELGLRMVDFRPAALNTPKTASAE